MSLRRGGTTGCSGGTCAKFVCKSLVTCNHYDNVNNINMYINHHATEG